MNLITYIFSRLHYADLACEVVVLLVFNIQCNIEENDKTTVTEYHIQRSLKCRYSCLLSFLELGL